MRHGATAGTAARRYSGGGTDEPLSPAGRAALVPDAHDADVTAVFTSGMARCEETARLLFPGARLVAVPGLREMEFGRFEGKSFEDLRDDAAYRAWVESGCEGACPDGESRAAFARRCAEAFRRCLAHDGRDGRAAGGAASQEAGDVAGAVASRGADGRGRACFVVHAGTVRALLSELAEPPVPYFSADTPPGGRWECAWDGARLRVLRAPSATADQGGGAR